MKYFVMVNDSKFSFETFEEANKFFKSFKDYPASSYRVGLFDSIGALINHNY